MLRDARRTARRQSECHRFSDPVRTLAGAVRLNRCRWAGPRPRRPCAYNLYRCACVFAAAKWVRAQPPLRGIISISARRAVLKTERRFRNRWGVEGGNRFHNVYFSNFFFFIFSLEFREYIFHTNNPNVSTVINQLYRYATRTFRLRGPRDSRVQKSLWTVADRDILSEKIELEF